MTEVKSAFEKISGDETLASSVRQLRIPLQAELLRAGAEWEESLAILKEMINHRRLFGSAGQALAWYRSPYHPNL